MRCHWLVMMLLCFVASKLWSQRPIGNQEPAIEVLGYVGKNEIKLRWAPNSPLVWKYTNEYGYYIERHTIVKDGEILSNPIIQRLHTNTIMPKPMMQWETFVDQNDYAAVAAQAIYGEDFEVEMENGGSEMMAIFNQAKVLEQRFSFALYAADQDFEVANFSGLAYVDTDVKPGERYLYKIFTNVPEEKMNIRYGGIYLGLQDYRELPQPQEFVGVFKDKSVMLSWNYKLLEREYNSYILERSTDNGNTFAPIIDVPIANLSNTEEQTGGRMMYLDSLPQNNKEYQYRLKGISPFGEVGPASKVITGKGIKGLAYSAAITEARLQPDNTSALIQWEFPEEGMDALSHFELNRSDEIKKGYQVLQSNIDKRKRSMVISNLSVINYFTITAVGRDGSSITSFPQMVQPVDDTPPEIPFGLTGTIDSTGVVQLSWQQNTEADFFGYRVFRANLKKDEFTQITFKPIPQSSMMDTINIKTLNKKIYYKVQAFDKRYNPSGFSEVLELDRPDIVPPTQAVFRSFKADKGAIELQWITSSSEDAAKTLVYRKEKGADTSWQLIIDASLPQSSFTDETAQPGRTYLYTLVTIDASGLESEPVTPLTIRLPDTMQKREIDKFSGEVNRQEKRITLHWKYKLDPVNEFLLYRAEEEHKPTLYKVFTDQEEKFIDKNLKVNTRYTYLLKAVLTSGASSPIKRIEIEY